MPDFKTKISARCFSGLGALFPFNLPWVEIVGQAARLDYLQFAAYQSMHGPCAIFMRRAALPAALPDPQGHLALGTWGDPSVVAVEAAGAVQSESPGRTRR